MGDGAKQAEVATDKRMVIHFAIVCAIFASSGSRGDIGLLRAIQAWTTVRMVLSLDLCKGSGVKVYH